LPLFVGTLICAVFAVINEDKVLPLAGMVGSIVGYFSTVLTDNWKPYKKISMAGKIYGHAGSPVAFGGQPMVMPVSPMGHPQHAGQPQQAYAYAQPQQTQAYAPPPLQQHRKN